MRKVAITRPNQVWGIDITYIRLLMYLLVIIDWYREEAEVEISMDGKG